MLHKNCLVLATESTGGLRCYFTKDICEKATEPSFLIGESGSRISITPQYVAELFDIIKVIVCEPLIEV